MDALSKEFRGTFTQRDRDTAFAEGQRLMRAIEAAYDSAVPAANSRDRQADADFDRMLQARKVGS